MLATFFRSGMICWFGLPNVGKSSLLNKFLNYPLSIISHKPQTTRHYLVGCVSGKNYQIVHIDTPGWIRADGLLQEFMMRQLTKAVEGSDQIGWVVDCNNPILDSAVSDWVKGQDIPFFIVLNKSDLLSRDRLEMLGKKWRGYFPSREIMTVSTFDAEAVKLLQEKLSQRLPVHPPYYDMEEVTNINYRFLVSEIVRKQIFMYYADEIPYATGVAIKHFENREDIIFIEVIIYTEREQQKKIIIGKNGLALKRVGVKARKEIEILLKNRVYLEQRVKVLPNWRKQKKYFRVDNLLNATLSY